MTLNRDLDSGGLVVERNVESWSHEDFNKELDLE